MSKFDINHRVKINFNLTVYFSSKFSNCRYLILLSFFFSQLSRNRYLALDKQITKFEEGNVCTIGFTVSYRSKRIFPIFVPDFYPSIKSIYTYVDLILNRYHRSRAITGRHVSIIIARWELN